MDDGIGVNSDSNATVAHRHGVRLDRQLPETFQFLFLVPGDATWLKLECNPTASV